MGINIFAIVPVGYADQPINIAEELNEKYGGRYFDWCDVFKGDDAAMLMSIDEALKFEDEAGPFYVYHKGRLRKTHAGNDAVRDKWEPLLKKANDGNHLVVFIKARG